MIVRAEVASLKGQVSRAKLASLKGQLSHAGAESANFDKVVGEVWNDSKRLLLHLNFILVGSNWAEVLTRSLVKESLTTVHAVVPQLDYYTVSRLQHGLRIAYLSVRVPCPEALTRVSGVAAASVRWKGEESVDEKEAEPSVGIPAETCQGSAKATCSGESGK